MRTLLALTVLAASAFPAAAIQVEKLRVTRPAAQGGGQADIEVVSGQALVRFDPALGRGAREAALAQRGARFLQDLPNTGWSQVALPEGSGVQSGLAVLSSVPGVLEAAPNHAYRVTRVPNDPSYAQQYHLGKVNAPAAWEYGIGDSTMVTVAVMDAGIDGTHGDLSGKFVGNAQFCDPGPTKTAGGGDETACVNEPTVTPVAACNHATRVSGVAAASTDNGSGVSGVSWGAKLVSVRVFRTADCTSDCGGANCATDDPTIVNAINFVRSVNNKPAYGRIVLNISLGEEGTACPGPILGALNFAAGGSTGVVIAVSAGNGASTVAAPANCASAVNGVIPVGATDSNDAQASFSDTGPELAAYGVAAPGVSIVTTDLGGGVTGGATGTSFSAPLVSGLAALILADKPGLSPVQVRDILRGSTDSVGLASVSAARPASNSVGAGRVNAFKAVKLAVEGTLAGFAGDQKVIAFPNPLRTSEGGSATITIPAALQGRDTKVSVYTIDGQLVRDLKAQTTWDGKNDHGNAVASGVYLILVKTSAGSSTAKIAVLR